jgi:hypothetical protein
MLGGLTSDGQISNEIGRVGGSQPLRESRVWKLCPKHGSDWLGVELIKDACKLRRFFVKTAPIGSVAVDIPVSLSHGGRR